MVPIFPAIFVGKALDFLGERWEVQKLVRLAIRVKNMTKGMDYVPHSHSNVGCGAQDRYDVVPAVKVLP
jgi:hypothetical protein